MNVSLKYHASVYKGLDDEAAAAARAARAESTCSECGSDFGMRGGWDREAVRTRERFTIPFTAKKAVLYICSWDDHELYQTCWACNPNEVVPEDFTLSTPEQVATWLARECQCPDCVRERGQLGPSPLVAALQTFQLIEEAIKEANDH